MWECSVCYAQVPDERRTRHRSWHDDLDRKVKRLEQRIRELEYATR